MQTLAQRWRSAGNRLSAVRICRTSASSAPPLACYLGLKSRVLKGVRKFDALPYGGRLEHRESKLIRLKFTVNAENLFHVMCRLSWSISSDFGQFTLEMYMCCSLKSRKIHSNPLFWRVQGRSRSSMLIVGIPPESSIVSSACYDKQQVPR